jgi:DNA-binding MarR family transcriptional regulator
MSDEKLDEVKSLLEDIKGILLLANQEKLEEMKRKLLRPGSVESSVYELCDGSNTAQDIAAKLQKSPEYAGAVISSLRRKGLIRTVDVNGRKISVQAF